MNDGRDCEHLANTITSCSELFDVIDSTSKTLWSVYISSSEKSINLPFKNPAYNCKWLSC